MCDRSCLLRRHSCVFSIDKARMASRRAGKMMGIRDMIKTAGSKAVLAVTAPKNNDEELALGNQFISALGLPLRGHWSTRKPKLMGHLHQYGTECPE